LTRGCRLQAKLGLEGFPKSLEDADGAGFSDGSEAMVDAAIRDSGPGGFRGELGAAVGDENRSRTEAGRGSLEEPCEHAARGLYPEGLPSEGHPGEDVEDDGDMEAE